MAEVSVKKNKTIAIAMDITLSSQQLITEICQQLKIQPLSSSLATTTVSNRSPITLSIKVWNQFCKSTSSSSLLRNVLASNQITTNIGLLIGTNHDNNNTEVIVTDLIPVQPNSNETKVAAIFRTIMQDDHQENNCIGWYIETLGVGIKVPAIELNQMKACLETLNGEVPNSLELLVVVDSMKSDGVEEAHLECYDLSNIDMLSSLKWDVEE